MLLQLKLCTIYLQYDSYMLKLIYKEVILSCERDFFFMIDKAHIKQKNIKKNWLTINSRGGMYKWLR